MTDSTEYSNDPFFSEFKISPDVKSSIVIPVKDEESYIVNTLSSFAVQVDIFGEPIDPGKFEILVLANNCTDQSVKYIKDFQRDHPDLNIYLQEIMLLPDQSNIGYVRRKLMECAYKRLCNNGGGIILTTDGDTMVETDWIAQNHWEINNGAEAVGGRILLYTDELEGLDEFTYLHHFKDEKYQLLIAELEGLIIDTDDDPLPRHHQHFNGSFAITSDCYARSGGVPDVKYLEDCAFFERLENIDARIRHSYRVTVQTSARCIGRTEVGLSYQLNVWKNLGDKAEQYFVESCDSIVTRLIEKKSLMNLWKLKDQNNPDFFLMIKNRVPDLVFSEEVYSSLHETPYFGEWYKKLMNLQTISYRERFPDVCIDTAIKDLQIKLEEISNYDFSQTSIL